MHAKTDSEGTSVDTSWPPRSPRRPVYYVQSPSNPDVEKMSFRSSPTGSPAHHFYHCSPIHHSRESSTSRFSAPLKNPKDLTASWKQLQIYHHRADDHDDEVDGGYYHHSGRNVRLYVCGFLFFVLLFSTFCLILWGASKAYKPEIVVKSIVFENCYVQAGSDQSGVQTDMLSLNSTVKIHYRNPATFFAVHVTCTPLELHYLQLKIAYIRKTSNKQGRSRLIVVGQWGYRKKKTLILGASRVKTAQSLHQLVKFQFFCWKTGKESCVSHSGHQVPLYGGVPHLAHAEDHIDKVAAPLNLTFVVQSRAYILGQLVKSKFYNHVRCSVTLNGNRLSKPHNLLNSCSYH